MVAPNEFKWEANSLIPNTQVAVLDGDPSKAGSFYAIQVKAPDGTIVPPHWHPMDEHIIVLQGTMGVGPGEKFDRSAGREMPVGSYVRMPKEMRHFAWVEGETIMQVYGIGPLEINYVNPADDPRKRRDR